MMTTIITIFVALTVLSFVWMYFQRQKLNAKTEAFLAQTPNAGRIELMSKIENTLIPGSIVIEMVDGKPSVMEGSNTLLIAPGRHELTMSCIYTLTTKTRTSTLSTMWVDIEPNATYRLQATFNGDEDNFTYQITKA